MIITKLKGGLGNQMFQYAAGRSLSLRHKTTLMLDLSYFETQATRDYHLRYLNVIENIVTPAQGSSCTDGPWNRYAGHVRRFATCLRGFRASDSEGGVDRPESIQLYPEPHYHWDAHFPHLSDNVCLEGYWQCEKYFLDIRDVLRREFSVHTPLTGLNRETSEEIQACDSISIHVRRGDYAHDLKTNRMHGLCSIRYYVAAAGLILEQVTDPHFFVFSDDQPWVQENLHLSTPVTYVSHNTAKEAHEDLRLITMCKHHVIANSSFSWWGAWLGEERDTIVVAPQQWLRSTALNCDDVIPQRWHKLAAFD